MPLLQAEAAIAKSCHLQYLDLALVTLLKATPLQAPARWTGQFSQPFVSRSCKATWDQMMSQAEVRFAAVKEHCPCETATDTGCVFSMRSSRQLGHHFWGVAETISSALSSIRVRDRAESKLTCNVPSELGAERGGYIPINCSVR